MQLPKELTDSILQSVLAKVKGSVTPQDDTSDDDDGILGLVKRSLSPDQDKDEGIMGLLSGALSGGSGGGIMDSLSDLLGGDDHDAKEPAQAQGSGILGALTGLLGGGSQKQASQESSGGIMDLLSGMLGGGSQKQETQESGGIVDLLSGVLGGNQPQSQVAEKESGIMSMIKDAIGGEGVIGDLLENLLQKKGLNASNLAADSAGAADLKDNLVELISKFVLNKVTGSLQGGSASQGNTVSKIIDMLTPDN
ncbi:MAG TPA: hypothetical protein P5533_05210 [Candidatus Cloacimonadota bacterium]|nr:hypothetical protein [Candidatus Cloacimonadota bacterium]